MFIFLKRKSRLIERHFSRLFGRFEVKCQHFARKPGKHSMQRFFDFFHGDDRSLLGGKLVYLLLEMLAILLKEEFRRSPVEVGSLSHYLRVFFTSQVVVWDFFHEQYNELYSIFFKSPGEI